MYNKKSDYAINKRNPDTIVYTDADKNEIRLLSVHVKFRAYGEHRHSSSC